MGVETGISKESNNGADTTGIVCPDALGEVDRVQSGANVALHRGGDKCSLFEIDGILCTLVICRDGRHPELYRIPAMAGAQILFHPSCSSDEIEAVCWKRTSGRAQQPVGPNTKIFHCVANTIGESPDGKQTSSGSSFIREPSGIPLAEAGFYQEEMITSVLDLERADRSYVLDSMKQPPFLAPYWKTMIQAVRKRADMKPE
jgi:predicted amidohydrolase